MVGGHFWIFLMSDNDVPDSTSIRMVWPRIKAYNFDLSYFGIKEFQGSKLCAMPEIISDFLFFLQS